MPRKNGFVMIAALVCMVTAACGSGGQAAATATATPPSAVPTLVTTESAANLTATAFIATATAMGESESNDALLAPTSTPSGPCTPSRSNRFLGDRSDTIQAALDEAGIKEAVVSVVAVEETQDCATFNRLETLYIINAEVQSLTDREALGNLAADMLAVLVEFPPESIPGSRPVTLSLRFDRGSQQRTVESDLGDALQHYHDGLRGPSLLDALGGLR